MPRTREIYGNLAHLPPRDAWLQDPDTVTKFFAPTDDRGFVMPDATIETVLELFEPDYIWPVDWQKDAPQIFRPDDHHFQWVADLYESWRFPGSPISDLPRRFRNLPSNRGLLPRQFHNVIHAVTKPPQMPKIRKMEQHVRSYETAVALFRHAERAIMLESLIDNATDNDRLQTYVKQYDSVFEGYSENINRALGLDAFKLIGIEDEFNIASPTELRERLGSCALMNIPNYTNQYFVRPSIQNGGPILAA